MRPHRPISSRMCGPARSAQRSVVVRKAGNDGHSPLSLHVGLRLPPASPKPAPAIVSLARSESASSADGRMGQRSGMTPEVARR